MSKWYFAALWALLASGCTSTPPVVTTAAAPESPNVGIRPTSYSPVLAPYTPRRPVDPKSWRDMNEEIAPKPEGEQS